MGDSKKNAGGKFRTALPEGLRLKETYKASESLKSRIMSAACGEDGVCGGRLADGVPGGASAGRDSMSGRRWPRILVQIFGPVAAVLALAGVFLFVPMSSLKATDTVFDMAAGIFSRSKSFVMEVKVRTDPAENFSYVDPRLGFVRHRLTVEPSTGRWRLEKHRKVAVNDGENIWSWNRPSMLGTKMALSETGAIGDFALLADPSMILIKEKERAEAISWSSYRKKIRGNMITVTVFTRKQGSFANDYMLYMSTEEADTRRVYEFDRRTGELTGLRIDMVKGRKSVTVMELVRIEYDAEIPDDAFIPCDGVEWLDITSEPEGNLFSGITPVQAVSRMFTYMDPWRPDVLKEILWNYHLDRLKDTYEGSRILKIRRPFRSGTYCGVYVPVTIEKRDGSRDRLTVALRNDNQDGVWVVDGGI